MPARSTAQPDGPQIGNGLDLRLSRRTPPAADDAESGLTASRACGRPHARGDLLLEQLRLRHRAGRARDSRAAGRGSQHDLVRPIELGPLAAAALIVTAPVLLLTVLAQPQIVAGLTAGTVKGG